MPNATIPAELALPIPRPVRARRNPLMFIVIAAGLAAIATTLIVSARLAPASTIAWVAVVGIAIFAIVGGLPWLALRQQRRLLATGNAAAAVIVEKHKYMTPRHPRAQLVYEFTDHAGRKVRGVRMGLPVAILGDGAIARPELAAMLANPTVVYDRGNPNINMLYPFDQVEIAIGLAP